MELQNYVQDAIRTESQISHINTNVTNLVAIMKVFVAAGNLLDDLKKNIYYNKPINAEKWSNNQLIIKNNNILGFNVNPTNNIELDPRLFHAIIGIATESTELVEAVLTAIQNETDIDHINVLEEWGDINWYGSLLIDSTNADWNNILETNIAKLKARYPEKFTSEAAINRDLDTEREILETQTFQV